MRYCRQLPHCDVIGQPLFVTFRLYGSLPPGRAFPNDRLTSGKAFVAMDHLLDRADLGPRYLGLPEIAEMVMNSLADGERRFNRYDLHSFVVMPNHVHLLVTPRVISRSWLGPLKGFTGHEAIRMLNPPQGTHFWQPESFDRLIPDDRGCERVRHYIEWNPVKAGLAQSPEDFPFSSASRLRNLALPSTLGCLAPG